jgi:hypothetical protein
MSDNDNDKILITGVGGCGSGFIWNLLGHCGFDNGGVNEWMRHSGIRRAVKEGRHKEFPTPKVIKHLGGFLTNLNYHIDTHDWKVEHIFFCVASMDLQMKAYRRRRKNSDVEKHLHDYQYNLGKGLTQILERDHPFTMIRCPRSIKDPLYCYNQLKVVLGDMTYEEFLVHHQAQISPRHLKRLDGYS